MNKITQVMHFPLALIKYAEKHGVAKAAIKYKTNRQYIYRWKQRYNGTIESLRDLSRKPHHHPNQHTEQEIRLIHASVQITRSFSGGYKNDLLIAYSKKQA